MKISIKQTIIAGIMFGALLFAVSRANAQTNLFHNQSKDYEGLGTTYANRPTSHASSSSKFFWCTDCAVATTCSAASGTGAWGFWQPGTSAWACAGSLPTALAPNGAATGDLGGTYPAPTVTGFRGQPLKVGAPSVAGQVYLWNTGNSDFELGLPASSGSNPILSYAHTTYGGAGISVGSGAPVTILTSAVTMPAAGCPCRALVNWNLAGTASSSIQVGGWVKDGTNAFGGSQSNTGSIHGGTPGSSLSTVTYANNANVTFTLFSQTDSGTFTVKSSGPISVNVPTFLDVAVIPSN